MAQHALQVQEEFCGQVPHQGPDERLRGPILTLGAWGLQRCRADTPEGKREASCKSVKPTNGTIQKAVPRPQQPPQGNLLSTLRMSVS